MRLSGGIARGKRRPARLSSAEDVVVDQHVLEPLAAAAGSVARRFGAGVGARERQRRVRERPELEVVGGVRALVERGEHVLERLRRVDPAQPERRHAAQRHGGHDAERAEPDPRGAQQVAVLRRQLALAAVAEHELDPLDLGRQVRQPRAGAVRAGGQRAGHRLDVDVAEVGQREAAQVQLAAEAVQRDAGLHPHEPGPSASSTRVHPLEREQRAGGQHAAGERVAGARDPHRRRRARSSDRRQLRARRRPLDRRRLAALRTRPVDPRGHAADLSTVTRDMSQRSTSPRTGCASATRRARSSSSTCARTTSGRPGASRAPGTSSSSCVAAQADTIERDRPVVFYCRVGSRSEHGGQRVPPRRLRRLLDGRRPRWPGTSRACRSSRATDTWRPIDARRRCSAAALALLAAAPASAAPELVKLGDFSAPVHVASPPRTRACSSSSRTGWSRSSAAARSSTSPAGRTRAARRACCRSPSRPTTRRSGRFYVFLTTTDGSELKVRRVPALGDRPERSRSRDGHGRAQRSRTRRRPTTTAASSSSAPTATST